jgi:DNA-binding NarL/FixJ family response regulator
MPEHEILITRREEEVINLVVQGLKDEEIAERLVLNQSEMHHILRSVYDKLSVSDRLELIVHALYHGLAKPPC